MKKLISALLGIALATAPVASEAREHWHGVHGGHGGDFIAPLIIGGVIGVIISNSDHQQPINVYPQVPTYSPPPVYPVYHTVTTYTYYDRFRGTCQINDTFDQYNTFVTRQTVCYGH